MPSCVCEPGLRSFCLEGQCADTSRKRLRVHLGALVAAGLLTGDGFAAIDAAAPQHLADVRRFLLDHIRPDELASVADIFERIAESARETQ